MRYNEENIKKLASGEVALKVDRNDLELTAKVVDYVFPKDKVITIEHLRESDVKYVIRNIRYIDLWFDLHEQPNIPVLIVSDFITQGKAIKQPKTSQERDELVKQLQAMEFEKELPSELNHELKSISSKEHILIALLRMRDVYRDGWVSDTEKYNIFSYCVEFRSGDIVVESYTSLSTPLSFPTEELARQFLENFREDLETVKHLIS